MKVRMDAKSLLAAIESARAFTDPRATTSALRSVRVDANEGRATVCGNAIDCGARFSIPAEIAILDDAGAACFRPAAVSTLLKGADGNALLDVGEQSARVKLGLAELAIESTPAADFAAWPEQPEGSAFLTVEAGAFARSLAATIPVACGVLDRPALRAVRVEIPTDFREPVRIVATDGRRLHVARVCTGIVEVPEDAEGACVATDVPIDAARKLERLLVKRRDGKVRISVHPKRLVATAANDFEFFAAASKSPFPEWRKAIPSPDGQEGVFAVSSRAILSALEKFCGMGFTDVRLEFTARGIELFSASRAEKSDDLVSLRQVVPAADAEAMGNPAVFNPSLLADAIEACRTSDVIFCRRDGRLFPFRAPSFASGVTAFLMALHE